MPERRTRVHWEEALHTEVDYGEEPRVQRGGIGQETVIGVTVPLRDGRSVFFTDTLLRHIVKAYKAEDISLDTYL